MKIVFDKEVVIIGVVSDTHVPDRVGMLHPDIVPTFQQHNVDLIIHAGDISTYDVIRQLENIAAVLAVRGNRDLWQLKKLSSHETITIHGVRILITHGQGSFLSYLLDKIPNFIFGYRFDRFFKKLSSNSDEFDLVVFGHSHRAENKWIDGKLYFNPGSASDSGIDKAGPSIGLIKIWKGGKIEASIIRIEKQKIKRGRWVKN